MRALYLRSIFVVSVSMLFAAPSTSPAQDRGAVASSVPETDSTLVRVEAPSVLASSVTGALDRISEDTLYVQQADFPEPTGIPVIAITKLERSTGKSGNWWRGALISFMTAETVLILSTLEKPCSACEVRSDASVTDHALVGTGSLVVGALIGALIKTRDWTSTTIPRLQGGSSMSVRFGTKKIGVSVSF